ncbi:hypothetical protein SBA4_2510019 [Candidatus Sulfopaludibacter sp. SbA4]|nr:hypothetical protein SBA4_2510019 [Candidatus Sulfopaludibacter sp. SbA4]
MMDAILSATAKPPLLRAGVQQAIAAGDDDLTAAVEFELISVLQAPSFRGSLRSAAFLRFVVEETLAGRQDLLKERTVGAAVLGKAPGYDTGADSGVRVRANEVRKRLAAYYDSAAPKAGFRIELPSGTYAPRFVPCAAPSVAAGPRSLDPPSLRLWQLAAPSLVAIFLALISIRGGVESNDSFSRFWNHALAGGTAIVIAVDADADNSSSISPAMADAAMPFESLASAFELPVHIVAADRQAPAARSCVIRISTRHKPSERALLYLNGAAVFRGQDGAELWLWADSAEKLRSAAQTLASRSGFPEIP